MKRRHPPFILDNGEPFKLVDNALDTIEIPRYGVYTWNSERYRCTDCGADLVQLQREYDVPDERVLRKGVADKL